MFVPAKILPMTEYVQKYMAVQSESADTHPLEVEHEDRPIHIGPSVPIADDLSFPLVVHLDLLQHPLTILLILLNLSLKHGCHGMITLLGNI